MDLKIVVSKKGAYISSQEPMNVSGVVAIDARVFVLCFVFYKEGKKDH